MNTMVRYVVGELAKVFLIALCSLTFTMILGAVVQEAYKEGLGLRQIVQLIPYIVPDALRFTMPATALFAACSVFGRMAGANEIVALKALGISPLTFLWPAVVLAFLLSLATVWVNDLAVSWGRNGVRRVVLEAVDEIAYSMLRVQRSYHSKNFAINVKRVDGRKLIEPTFTFLGGGSRSVTVRCQEAELNCDPQSQVLSIHCRNGRVDVDGEVTMRFPGTITREVPLQDASNQKRDQDRPPSWLALCEITEQLGYWDQELDVFQQDLAAQAGFQMITGDFDTLTGSEWFVQRDTLHHKVDTWHRLRTEPHRRWSNGLSCLCFVLIGAPMAIRRRNSDFLTSFFLCFLPILLVYYPLLMLGVDRAKSGDLPPYSVWLGNGVLLLWSWWLLRKVIRY